MTLRLPPALQAEAAELAEHLGVSLNGLITMALRGFVQYQTGKRVKVPATLPDPAAVAVSKVGPNQPCPCGSGQKYKRCHGKA